MTVSRLLGTALPFLLLSAQAADAPVPLPLPWLGQVGAGIPVPALRPVADGRCSGCSVVLISVDTLRPDHLGCYGYARPTSPNIDRFRQDAVLFRTAIAHASSTLRSHASIFTSLLPFQHQANASLRTPLPEEAVTLAEVLRDRGYATAAFTGGGQMHPTYGLGQGFDAYESEPLRSFAAQAAKARAWLEANADEPFFLFLHTYELHVPFAPRAEHLALFEARRVSVLPDVVTQTLVANLNARRSGVSWVRGPVREHIVNRYDAEIRSVDEAFGEFVGYLRSRGLYDRLLIVLTSDHGEELGEHGRVAMHDHSLYDEVIRVPLIVKFPGSAHAGRAVGDQVRSIDIAPTVLDVLGIEAAAPFEGASLLPWVGGRRRQATFAFSQRGTGARGSTSIRTQRWKLYDGRLFDLVVDPLEREDVSESYPLVRRALEVNLTRILAGRALPGSAPVTPGEELLRQLRALGYVR